jgi:Acyl-CoA dehydrogenase, C-terminal domain
MKVRRGGELWRECGFQALSFGDHNPARSGNFVPLYSSKRAPIRFMARVYVAGAMERIESAAKAVIAAAAEGDMLRSQMAILRRLSKYEPHNTIALREKIAAKVIEAGKYQVM